ncbi:MAG: metal-dependent hydrolase [Halobacteriaceae archaeon]
MPSTLVHVAIAGLLAAALLRSAFGVRSVLVVLAAAAIPDLDTFLGLWIVGGHRAILHTLLLPVGLGAVLAWDTHREGSWLRTRWGEAGVRTAWVALAGLTVAGIGPDLATNGVNVLYPVVDRFVELDGKVVVSTQRGIVQTFIDFSTDQPAGGTSMGTTNTTHYETGIDPSKGADPAAVDRVFPLVRSGTQALLVLTSGGVLAARFLEDRRRPP